jgi:hypothetical protein
MEVRIQGFGIGLGQLGKGKFVNFCAHAMHRSRVSHAQLHSGYIYVCMATCTSAKPDCIIIGII